MSVNLIDLGAIQHLFSLFFTIYGMMTYAITGNLRKNVKFQFFRVRMEKKYFIFIIDALKYISQIWTYGLIIWCIERVSI